MKDNCRTGKASSDSHFTAASGLANMKLAISKESDAKKLQFEIEPLIEPIPVHIVKGFYMLRYLKAREFKIKLLNAMNY